LAIAVVRDTSLSDLDKVLHQNPVTRLFGDRFEVRHD
jgi:hypothetical protein